MTKVFLNILNKKIAMENKVNTINCFFHVYKSNTNLTVNKKELKC